MYIESKSFTDLSAAVLKILKYINYIQNPPFGSIFAIIIHESPFQNPDVSEEHGREGGSGSREVSHCAPPDGAEEVWCWWRAAADRRASPGWLVGWLL